MLFQSQALSAFLAFTAVAHAAVITRADRLESYAYAKEPCSPEEVGFCQTYVQKFTQELYRDCRYFGADPKTTKGDLGPMCVYADACYHYCNPGGRTGYTLAPNNGNFTCACYSE